MKVGIIGTGAIGSAIATRQLGAGAEVYVWNRTPEHAQTVLDAGAHWCQNPAEVASSVEVLGLALATPEATRAVFYRARGILEGIRPGLWLIDHATEPLALIRELATPVAESRGTLLDAPILGNPVIIAGGQALVLLGAEQTPAELEAYFGAISPNLALAGERGKAMLLKLALNLALALNAVALAEGTALAEAFGLTPTIYLEAWQKSMLGSPYVGLKGDKIIRGDHSPQFALGLMHKDLSLIQAEADRAGAPLFMGNQAQAIFALAERWGLGELDTTALIELYRRHS